MMVVFKMAISGTALSESVIVNSWVHLDIMSREAISCYNLKLGSGCNLGKDLSKDRRVNQLVKHKNTRVYLQLYILKD